MLDHMMNLFSGFSIITNPNLTVSVPFDRRVRGGYLNRWLIRERGVEVKPDPHAYVLELERKIVMHPETLRMVELGATSARTV